MYKEKEIQKNKIKDKQLKKNRNKSTKGNSMTIHCKQRLAVGEEEANSFPCIMSCIQCQALI